MFIKSSAFQNNKFIPSKYTFDGENISPPLNWGDIPSNTKSFVLIVDDPDAPVGIWVHWVVWGISANTSSLEESVSFKNTKIYQGINDFRTLDYKGPSPPSGTHRYYFKLYALDCFLDLTPAASKMDVEESMRGHVLEESNLIGLYTRF